MRLYSAGKALEICLPVKKKRFKAVMTLWVLVRTRPLLCQFVGVETNHWKTVEDRKRQI